jgi:Cys-rich four helix bundle protein (predicted Tat secretion target)
MDRRDFVMMGATVAAAAVSGRALAADEPKAEKHDHAAHMAGGKTPSLPAGAVKNAAIVDAAADCIKSGEVCLEHCLEALRLGDASMVRCSKTVSAMLPMCRTILALAVQDATHLREAARVCAKICRDCEVACKEHAEHHEACRRCFESCRRCAEACEKAAA